MPFHSPHRRGPRPPNPPFRPRASVPAPFIVGRIKLLGPKSIGQQAAHKYPTPPIVYTNAGQLLPPKICVLQFHLNELTIIKTSEETMPSKYQDVPVELLHSLLRYEADTGHFFWKERPVSMFEDRGGRYTAEWCCKTFNKKHAGKRALTALSDKGYFVGRIFKHPFSAHRVAWALHHGSWPSGDLDHINRVRSDNRSDNLRLATKTQNGHNKIVPRAKSPYIGVTFYKATGTWVARISKDRKKYHLGTFTDLKEAAKVRDARAKELYGERALLNFPT